MGIVRFIYHEKLRRLNIFDEGNRKCLLKSKGGGHSALGQY